MHTKQLPQDYALVLQQVEENGEEDFTNLVESLRLDPKRLTHIVQALQHKGLIKIQRHAHESWITLSSKGQRLMASIWPESSMRYSY